MLPGLLGHLLPQLQHVQRGHGDGHAPVEHALPGHLRVDDLQEGGGFRHIVKWSHSFGVGNEIYLVTELQITSIHLVA